MPRAKQSLAYVLRLAAERTADMVKLLDAISGPNVQRDLEIDEKIRSALVEVQQVIADAKRLAVPTRIGQTFGRWTVLRCVGWDGHKDTHWRCRCECGYVGIVRNSTLLHGVKQGCNRCALLAKPIYRTVSKFLRRGVPQAKIARRIGQSRRQVGQMVKVVEKEQPKKRRQKTPAPRRYTAPGRVRVLRRCE